VRVLKTFTSEFLSRGLNWVRLVVIVPFINTESYALIVLLVTAEAFLGEIISYPQVRETLLRAEVSGEPLFAGILFWLFLAPLQIILVHVYFDSYISVLVVLLSSLAFMVYKVLLYSLRSADIDLHNKAKLLSALTGTALFFGLTIFISPYLYFICSAVSAGIVAYFVLNCAGKRYFLFQRPSLGRVAVGWLHYSTQSLAAVAWQYGNRFVAGAAFSAFGFSLFIRDYLLVSGVTFIFSAIMIIGERNLSVEGSPNSVGSKARVALLIFASLTVSWLIYCAALLVFFATDSFGVGALGDYSRDVDYQLLAVLMFLFLARAVQLVLAPLVISIGRRSVVTLGAMSSILFQAVAYWWLWGELDPVALAGIMLSSLCLPIALMAFFLGWRVLK
jgi:hypothetical protein